MSDVEVEELDPNNVTLADIFKILIQIRKDIHQNKTEVKILEDKIDCLEHENKNLKTRILTAERKIKKNNIVIYGLLPGNDVIDTVTNVIRTKLNINLAHSDVNNCYQNNRIKGTPIFLELISYLKKSEITRNSYKLKNTGIGIADEVPYEDRQERRQLVDHLKKAKKQNHNAKIRRNKLIIDGEEYTLSDLTSRENEGDVETTRQNHLANSGNNEQGSCSNVIITRQKANKDTIERVLSKQMSKKK